MNTNNSIYTYIYILLFVVTTQRAFAALQRVRNLDEKFSFGCATAKDAMRAGMRTFRRRRRLRTRRKDGGSDVITLKRYIGRNLFQCIL